MYAVYCSTCSIVLHADRITVAAKTIILKVGAHGERGARTYKGVWERSPQRGPGAEPLVRESGGRNPLKLKGF